LVNIAIIIAIVFIYLCKRWMKYSSWTIFWWIFSICRCITNRI